MKLFLNSEFQKHWQGRDPFDAVAEIDGTVYRDVKARKTLRFNINGDSYFLKLHQGVGWTEILRNLLQLRLPVISASNEWNALNRLNELGIDTMTIAAYGKKGHNPAQVRSFLITEELLNTESLEELCADWPTRKPAFRLKKDLIEKVAHISREMHNNGMCHRDFYICHFLLESNGVANGQDRKLYIIDLHRALIKKRLGRRWIEKDIAGLYFSSMDIGLTRRDLFRFLCYYEQKNLRSVLTENSQFWNKVSKKAEALYKKHHSTQ